MEIHIGFIAIILLVWQTSHYQSAIICNTCICFKIIPVLFLDSINGVIEAFTLNSFDRLSHHISATFETVKSYRLPLFTLPTGFFSNWILICSILLHTGKCQRYQISLYYYTGRLFKQKERSIIETMSQVDQRPLWHIGVSS